MCTDHQRTHSVAAAPTITRVPLVRVGPTPRWSRRRLLVNAGIGTASLAVLAACGSSSDAGVAAASTETTTTPPPSAGDTSVTTASAPDAEPSTTSTADTPDAPALQLQHVSLGFVSAYVLVRGREAAIVDTGVAGSGAAIGEALADLGLGPSDVRHIVLTHNHGDHVGGLGELEAAMTNATVYAGAGDIDTIESSLSLAEVGDGDEVFGLGVVNTPGHTAGSISVFDTETGLLVAGDAINGDGQGGITGANPNFTADMNQANASIAKMAALMPQVAAFGHGGAPVSDDVTAKLTALA